MDFVVAFLVVRKSYLHASFDIVRRDEHDAAEILQPVVDRNEIVENRIGEFVPFVEYEQRSFKRQQMPCNPFEQCKYPFYYIFFRGIRKYMG